MEVKQEKQPAKLPAVSTIASGVVVRIYPTYAILLFEDGWTGLLHISELSHNFIRHFSSFVTMGAIYNVKVISVDEERGNIRVSLKQMTTMDKRKAFAHKKVPMEEIDCSALMERLPEWIKQENEGENQA